MTYLVTRAVGAWLYVLSGEFFTFRSSLEKTSRSFGSFRPNSSLKSSTRNNFGLPLVHPRKLTWGLTELQHWTWISVFLKINKSQIWEVRNEKGDSLHSHLWPGAFLQSVAGLTRRQSWSLCLCLAPHPVLEVADQGLSLRSGWSVLLCLEEATELMAWRCHGWRPGQIHNYNLDCCNAMNASFVRCVGRVLS